MIRNDEQFQNTRAALADLETALLQLKHRRGEIHPDRFALMTEPIIENIEKLRHEIDEYLGVPTTCNSTGQAKPVLQRN